MSFDYIYYIYMLYIYVLYIYVIYIYISSKHLGQVEFFFGLWMFGIFYGGCKVYPPDMCRGLLLKIVVENLLECKFASSAATTCKFPQLASSERERKATIINMLTIRADLLTDWWLSHDSFGLVT